VPPKATPSNSVFINCPFDPSFKPIFEAIVFCVLEIGFVPRCALEHDNSAVVRIDKIIDLIRKCDHGIHDLSYVKLDPATKLPRFNMPYELGLYVGCRTYGDGRHKKKNCLVLDKDRYRYMKFISDLNGQDIRDHKQKPEIAISRVRDWLVHVTKRRHAVPSGAFIWRRYQKFQKALPKICQRLRIDHRQLLFVEYVDMVRAWRRHP